MADSTPVDKIYERITPLLKGKEGNIVAIEVDSGDFFLGKNAIEAFNEGRKKYPHKQFFFKRVGAKAAYHIGSGWKHATS